MTDLLKNAYFITGTDTGIGKTEVSLALMHLFNQQLVEGRQLIVAGMKPIASGGVRSTRGLQNEDASKILDQMLSTRESQSSSDRNKLYATINPYLFEQAVAPHIAAAKESVEINIDIIKKSFDQLLINADVTIVEGVGGWQVPINHRQTLPDLVVALNLPVIMVVGIRLGALNHALLTYQSIIDSGLECCAWVANIVDPEMLTIDENIQTLKQRLKCPCLGIIPFQSNPLPDTIADCLNIDFLLAD